VLIAAIGQEHHGYFVVAYTCRLQVSESNGANLKSDRIKGHRELLPGEAAGAFP